jgi:hypothetical protein
MRARARRAGTNGLTVLRRQFLSLIVLLFVFPVALGFIEPWDGEDERWIPWAVAVASLCALALMTWILSDLSRPSHRRPSRVRIGRGSSSGSAWQSRRRCSASAGCSSGGASGSAHRPGIHPRHAVDDGPDPGGHRAKATRDQRGGVPALSPRRPFRSSCEALGTGLVARASLVSPLVVSIRPKNIHPSVCRMSCPRLVLMMGPAT